MEEDIKRLLNTYKEIDKLYMEYVLHTKTGFSDHTIAADGSDYDTQSGTMDGKHTDPSKVSVHKPFSNPPGFGGLSKADQMVKTNIKTVTSTPKNKLINNG